MKVFVDTDSDIRLARRLRRDISQRGRELEGVLKQYNSFVKPSFDHYIAPLMAHADIIVPRGGDNEVAISLIVQHVQTQLQLVSLLIYNYYQMNLKKKLLFTERIQTEADIGQRTSGPTAAKFIAHFAVNPPSERPSHVYPKQGYTKRRVHLLFTSPYSSNDRICSLPFTL